MARNRVTVRRNERITMREAIAAIKRQDRAHCPMCGSVQLWYRKSFDDYRCKHCGEFGISHRLLHEVVEEKC